MFTVATFEEKERVESWSELKRMTSNPTPTKLFCARLIIVRVFFSTQCGTRCGFTCYPRGVKIILIVLLALCYVNQSTIHHATFLAKIESSFPQVLTRTVFFVSFSSASGNPIITIITTSPPRPNAPSAAGKLTGGKKGLNAAVWAVPVSIVGLIFIIVLVFFVRKSRRLERSMFALMTRRSMDDDGGVTFHSGIDCMIILSTFKLHDIAQFAEK